MQGDWGHSASCEWQGMRGLKRGKSVNPPFQIDFKDSAGMTN